MKNTVEYVNELTDKMVDLKDIVENKNVEELEIIISEIKYILNDIEESPFN